MIKHWKTQAVREVKPVTLYTTTTDSAVQNELDAHGNGGSLIMFARDRINTAEPTAERNHLDLARGAFGHYIGHLHRMSQPTNSQVEEIESFDPTDLLQESMGGARPFAVTIYEEDGNKEVLYALRVIHRLVGAMEESPLHARETNAIQKAMDFIEKKLGQSPLCGWVSSLRDVLRSGILNLPPGKPERESVVKHCENIMQSLDRRIGPPMW